MRVWLWSAGNWLGVTDDEGRAKLAAQASLRDGGTARVELAIAALGGRELSARYIRTGAGWTGHAVAGDVTWSPQIPHPQRNPRDSEGPLP